MSGPVVGKMEVPAAEVAPVSALPGVEATFAAKVTPTQLRHPRRTMFRTMFQAALAFALVWPVIVQELGLPDWAWVGVSVGLCGVIARVMAIPGVEEFMRRFLPWLAVAPKPPRA